MGYLAQDSVTVGGYNVLKQVFALANVSAPSLEALASDGIMGSFSPSLPPCHH